MIFVFRVEIEKTRIRDPIAENQAASLATRDEMSAFVNRFESFVGTAPFEAEWATTTPLLPNGAEMHAKLRLEPRELGTVAVTKHSLDTGIRSHRVR